SGVDVHAGRSEPLQAAGLKGVEGHPVGAGMRRQILEALGDAVFLSVERRLLRVVSGASVAASGHDVDVASRGLARLRGAAAGLGNGLEELLAGCDRDAIADEEE